MIGKALILLLGVASFSAHAQTKSDRAQHRLFGPIQTVTTEVAEFTNSNGKNVEGPRMLVETITYDERGNRIKRIDFNRDGSIAQTLVYTYDPEGRSTGYEEYSPGLSTPRKHIYVLDPEGKRSEYKIVQPTGSAGDEKYLFRYNARGHLIAEELYHKKELISRNENAFDDQGRWISQVIYNPDGTVSSRISKSIGSDGQTIERMRHDGDLLTYRIQYTYDHKGRLTTLNTTGSYVETDSLQNGDSLSEQLVAGKVVYIYNGKDQPKEIVTYNPDGSFRDRLVLSYDSQGNWTKKTRRIKSPGTGKEVPVEIEYRTITYQ